VRSSYRLQQRWIHGQATGVRHVVLAELFAVADWRGRIRLLDLAELCRATLGLVSCSEARGQRVAAHLLWRRQAQVARAGALAPAGLSADECAYIDNAYGSELQCCRRGRGQALPPTA
jgi:hypothetical protein